MLFTTPGFGSDKVPSRSKIRVSNCKLIYSKYKALRFVAKIKRITKLIITVTVY